MRNILKIANFTSLSSTGIRITISPISIKQVLANITPGQLKIFSLSVTTSYIVNRTPRGERAVKWLHFIFIDVVTGLKLGDCWLRDLARRLPELRRALTLARRPLRLRHVLDLADLVRSLSARQSWALVWCLSPREPRAWCSTYLPVSLGPE